MQCVLAGAVANSFSELGDKLVNLFSGFTIAYGVEILLFFLLVYYVSKVLRDNDATRLMLIYWSMIVVLGIIQFFTPLYETQFYLYFVLLISMFMLILFNVEVKKSLWDVHHSPAEKVEKIIGSGQEARSQAEVERCIADIIKALQNMSKNNIGALIILSKGNLPKQVLQSGVQLDAEISTQLIEGIFFPKAPLHDGAMIIRGHKIQAAGCFLPLTQKTSYPKDFGTRHRAGIGITEVSNVVSLVVSEETGIISIIKQGNVQRYADYDALKTALYDYYWQELPVTDKKSKEPVGKDLAGKDKGTDKKEASK
jgi:diadenylate cyclase